MITTEARQTQFPPVFAGRTMLIVDDHIESVDIAQMLLHLHGAQTISAYNGREAFHLTCVGCPSAILTDLSMPLMNGWELLYAVKSNPATAHIPVIAVTAHAMVGDRERALDYGFSGYIAKPIRARTFGLAVLRALYRCDLHGNWIS